MSLKSYLIDINTNIQSENWTNALKVCELAVKLPEAKTSFLLWSTYGQCAQQTDDMSTSEKAFIFASNIANVPSPQLQKIWKFLADIYEKRADWGNHASSLNKLYEILKEKGNVERSNTVAEIVAESYVKCKDYTTCGKFILRHLQEGAASEKEAGHVLSMVALLNKAFDLHSQVKVAVKSVSVGASGKSDKTATEAPEEWLTTEPLVEATLSAIDRSTGQTGAASVSEGVVAFLCRHLTGLRSSALESSSTNSFLTLLPIFLRLARLLPTCATVVAFALETYFFSLDTSEVDTVQAAERLLEASPQHPLASAVKAVSLLEIGMERSTRPLVTCCTKHWFKLRESPATARSAVVGGLLDGALDSTQAGTSGVLCLIASVIGGGLSGFRNMAFKDALNATQEALAIANKMQSVFGSLRPGLMTALQLARVRAVARVSHSVSTILPTVHFPDSQLETFFRANESSQTVDVDASIVRSSPLLVQRLVLKALMDMRLYANAIAVTDTLMDPSGGSGSSALSWVLSERHFCSLLALAESAKSNDFVVPLLRDLTLAEGCSASDAVAALQSVRRCGDHLLAELEAELHFRVGVAQWVAGGRLRTDKSACLASLMACAKVDPEFGSVYSWIGHYYAYVLKDVEKAAKCYIKALAYDPLDLESGVALSQIYVSAPTADRALKLWSDVLLVCPHAHWAYAIRGQFELSQERYDEAVEGFQRALELKPDDAHSWHGLGSAYSLLGQDLAALRALSRALTLLPTDVNVLCALGETERRLCNLPQSAEMYRTALSIAPGSVLALKGAGDVSLASAHNRLTIGWSEGAARAVLEGVAAVREALELPGCASHVSLWKLLGDLCAFVHNLGPSDIKLSDAVAACETPLLTASSGCAQYAGLRVMLLKAGEAYHQALRLTVAKETAQPNDVANRHCDVGNLCLLDSRVLGLSLGQGAGLISSASLLHNTDIQNRIVVAAEAFIGGLQVLDSHSGCWNGLGLCLRSCGLAKNKSLLASHMCFVRATQLDGCSAALSNIAAAVMTLDRSSSALARECLSVLQLSEPSPLLWLSLANILEREGGAGVWDAFNAAIEVSKPTEALIGAALSWWRLYSGLSAGLPGLTSDFSFGLRHEVEYRLRNYVKARPMQPTAWSLLAQALQLRGAWAQATEAAVQGLVALDSIAGSLLTVSLDPEIRTSVSARSAALTSVYERCRRRAMAVSELPQLDNLRDILGASPTPGSATLQSDVSPQRAVALAEMGEGAEAAAIFRDLLVAAEQRKDLLELQKLIILLVSLHSSVASPQTRDLLVVLEEIVDIALGGGTRSEFLKAALQESCPVLLMCARVLIELGNRPKAVDLLQMGWKRHSNMAGLRVLLAELLHLGDSCVAAEVAAGDAEAALKLAGRCLGQSAVSASDPTQVSAAAGAHRFLCYEDSPVRSYCRAAVVASVAVGGLGASGVSRHVLKAIFLDPSDNRCWAALAAQTFSDVVLSDGTNVAEIRSRSSGCLTVVRVVDSLFPECFESKESVYPIFRQIVHDDASEDALTKARKLAVNAGSDKTLTIGLYKEAAGGVEDENYDGSARMWRELGNAYAAATPVMAECAEFCYSRSSECIASNLRLSSGPSIDLNTVATALAWLRRYVSSQNFDDATKVRNILDSFEANVSTRHAGQPQAVSHVIRAAVFSVLGKPAKVASSKADALSLWAAVDVDALLVPFTDLATA